MRYVLAALVLTSAFIATSFSYRLEKGYSIERMDIYAEIMPNGDVIVDEDIEYRFTGSCSSVIRRFSVDGTGNFDIYKVFIIDEDKESAEARRSASGGINTYKIVGDDDHLEMTIYADNKDEVKNINIIYKLKDAVISSNSKYKLCRNFYDICDSACVKEGFLQIYFSEGKFDLDSLSYDIYADVDAEVTEEVSEDFIIIRFNELTSDLGIRLMIQDGYLGGEKEEKCDSEKAKNEEMGVGCRDKKIAAAMIMAVIVIFISAAFIFNKINKKKEERD